MSVLLDTQALLWLLSGGARMGPRARALIDAAQGVQYSAASIWEIQIKAALGKLRIDGDLAEALRSARLRELPIAAAHAFAIPSVDLPHRDPFDRLLLAQTTVEGMVLVTADAVLLGLDRADVADARA